MRHYRYATFPILSTQYADIQAEVETDIHGIRTDCLREIFQNWPASKPKPKVLYTIPVSVTDIERFKTQQSHNSLVWL